jgi:two-component system response regulator AlgR
MLNVLIVDDEPLARSRLTQQLADCGRELDLRVVGAADGGLAALEAVDQLHPDAVLLDIMMPDMGGIEVARHLVAREAPPAIIFVTAFDEHALPAFEVQALDYLLKPVRTERLLDALKRAHRLKRNEPRIEELARSLGSLRSHLTVSERGRLLLVPIEEILYLRAEMKYVTIRTAQKEHLTEESLTALEQEFGERFVRIHRNALVARAAIQGFQRVKARPDGADSSDAGEGHWEVVLKAISERLPISRRQWPTVKSATGV